MPQLSVLPTDTAPATTNTLYTYRAADYKITAATLFSLYTSADHLTIQPAVNTNVPLAIKGAAGQTANLLNIGSNTTFNNIAQITQYNGITTDTSTSAGVPFIITFNSISSGTSVFTYNVPAGNDGTYRISHSYSITARSAGAIQFTIAYVDETGTARTMSPTCSNSSSVTPALSFSNSSNFSYLGFPAILRVQGGTTITVTTTSITGTFSLFGLLEKVQIS